MTNSDKRLEEIRERAITMSYVPNGQVAYAFAYSDIQYLLDHVTDLGKKVVEKEATNKELVDVHLDEYIQENASLKEIVKQAKYFALRCKESYSCLPGEYDTFMDKLSQIEGEK